MANRSRAPIQAHAVVATAPALLVVRYGETPSAAQKVARALAR
jgi:hypothetical protein